MEGAEEQQPESRPPLVRGPIEAVTLATLVGITGGTVRATGVTVLGRGKAIVVVLPPPSPVEVVAPSTGEAGTDVVDAAAEVVEPEISAVGAVVVLLAVDVRVVVAEGGRLVEVGVLGVVVLEVVVLGAAVDVVVVLEVVVLEVVVLEVVVLEVVARVVVVLEVVVLGVVVDVVVVLEVVVLRVVVDVVVVDVDDAVGLVVVVVEVGLVLVVLEDVVDAAIGVIPSKT